MKGVLSLSTEEEEEEEEEENVWRSLFVGHVIALALGIGSFLNTELPIRAFVPDPCH